MVNDGTVNSAADTVTITAVGVTYWDTTEIPITPYLFSGAEIVTMPSIPVVSAAIGYVLQGTNTNIKVIDHGEILISGGNPVYITLPGGSFTNPEDAVPLSFNQINNDNSIGILFDNETTSLFFPNDGSVQSLPAGSYQVPIATYNAAGNAFEADTIDLRIFYKTETPTQTTMTLNVFVVAGVGGITTAAGALADAEIQGALDVLRNVYERNPNTALDVVIDVDVVPNSAFAVLETIVERDALFSGYPTSPTHDAMNIFIVSSLDYLPVGIIGVASRVPGPFNRQGTIQSGTVAEYQDDGGVGTILGFILAHEFGHYMGLYHTSQTNMTQDGIIGQDPIADTPVCTAAEIGMPGGIDNCPDRTNLMFPIVDNESDPPITRQQGTVIRLNPAVRLP